MQQTTCGCQGQQLMFSIYSMIDYCRRNDKNVKSFNITNSELELAGTKSDHVMLMYFPALNKNIIFEE